MAAGSDAGETGWSLSRKMIDSEFPWIYKIIRDLHVNLVNPEIVSTNVTCGERDRGTLEADVHQSNSYL